jgi:hypothetical protein
LRAILSGYWLLTPHSSLLAPLPLNPQSLSSLSLFLASLHLCVRKRKRTQCDQHYRAGRTGIVNVAELVVVNAGRL